jgi:hypothetical protein
MFKMIVSVALVAQLTGCANQPATTPATAATPAATTAAATAATPAATTAAATTTAPAQPAPPPGFKARKRNGETVYCTKVQPTGSLFPQDVCYTPQQLETLRAQQKKAADRLLTKPTGCRGQDCVTGGQ